MQYYSTGTLAKKIDKSRKTVWTWCAYGLPINGVVHRLECERWGRTYRISEEQWERFRAAINGRPVETPGPDLEFQRRDEAARKRCRAMGVRC